jgi:hypothetical protein
MMLVELPNTDELRGLPEKIVYLEQEYSTQMTQI